MGTVSRPLGTILLSTARCPPSMRTWNASAGGAWPRRANERLQSYRSSLHSFGRTDRGGLDRAIRLSGVGTLIPRELADRASQLRRLILGNQGVTVVDLDQLGIWNQVGEPASVVRGHDSILCCPDDQHRPIERAKRLGREDHVAPCGGTQVFGQSPVGSPAG